MASAPHGYWRLPPTLPRPVVGEHFSLAWTKQECHRRRGDAATVPQRVPRCANGSSETTARRVSGHRPAARRNSAGRLERCDAPSATERLLIWIFQRVNALKNVLAGIVKGVATVVFIAVADVAWGPAALVAAGSVASAQLGARHGRRLSPQALRAVIVVVGIAAIVKLVT